MTSHGRDGPGLGERPLARPATALRKLENDRAVDDAYRIGLHRLGGRQRDRPPGRELELRPVARTDDAAAVLVPVALAKRAVVVRAAVLDRVELAAAVVDPDEQASLANDLRRPGRELVRRGDLDFRH